MEPDDLKASRIKLEVELYKNIKKANPGLAFTPQQFRQAMAHTPFKAIRVHLLSFDVSAQMAVMETTQWSEIIDHWVKKELRGVATNPDEITSVGFGPQAIWSSRGQKKWVLDSREGAKSPYETFEDGDMLHVVMIQRQSRDTREVRWHPIAFNIRGCNYCGTLEYNGVKLKKCGNCQTAFYCDQTCQRSHWTHHKSECMKCAELLA
jgi:hypothetical protein